MYLAAPRSASVQAHVAHSTYIPLEGELFMHLCACYSTEKNNIAIANVAAGETRRTWILAVFRARVLHTGASWRWVATARKQRRGGEATPTSAQLYAALPQMCRAPVPRGPLAVPPTPQSCLPETALQSQDCTAGQQRQNIAALSGRTASRCAMSGGRRSSASIWAAASAVHSGTAALANSPSPASSSNTHAPRGLALAHAAQAPWSQVPEHLCRRWHCAPDRSIHTCAWYVHVHDQHA